MDGLILPDVRNGPNEFTEPNNKVRHQKKGPPSGPFLFGNREMVGVQGSYLRPLPCEFTDLNPESRKSTSYAPRLHASVTRVDRSGLECVTF